jgi:peroxiredoxin
VPELNRLAPDFELPDLEGHIHRLSGYRGKIVVVNFWSCECPHVERTDRAMLATLAQLREQATLLSIAPNGNESLEALKAAALTRRLPFVLRDAGHVVADLYEAQTTPHVFVIDREGVLRYRGAVDDVTFRRRQPTRFYLDEALEALLEGRPPARTEVPPYGCTIVRLD